jgi:hypothetical protein
MSNKSYYGSYRTRRFVEIFPNFEEFNQFYKASPFSDTFTEPGNLEKLYVLLLGEYGNSHIGYSSEDQFKFQMISLIFSFGPTWEKRLILQEKIRTMSLEEIKRGGRVIYNKAFNPSTTPGTGTNNELPYINEQNSNNYIKSDIEAYGLQIAMLETDVTRPFIAKFKPLFLAVVAPDYPLLYGVDPEDFETVEV